MKFLSKYIIGLSQIRKAAPPAAIAPLTICLVSGGIFFHAPETILALPSASCTAVLAAVAIPQAFATVPMSFSSASATCLGLARKLANHCPCMISSPSCLQSSISIPSACAQVIAAALPQKTPERSAFRTVLNFFSEISRKRMSRTSVIFPSSFCILLVRYYQTAFLLFGVEKTVFTRFFNPLFLSIPRQLPAVS